MNTPPEAQEFLAGQGWWLYVVGAVAVAGAMVTFSKNVREAFGPFGRWLSTRKERGIQRSMREQMAQDALDEVRVADLRSQVTFFREELATVRAELEESRRDARIAQDEARKAQEEARESQRLAAVAEHNHALEMAKVNGKLADTLEKLTQLSIDVQNVRNGQIEAE